jgi:hypothetical protein
VTGTPLNFGGMTGRALAVYLKLHFFKSCDHNFFYWPPAVQLYGPPYIRAILSKQKYSIL